LSTDDEIQILKEQTESLKKALKDAENRMKSLKSKLEKKEK
jgi:flagellar capping protein FliD